MSGVKGDIVYRGCWIPGEWLGGNERWVATTWGWKKMTAIAREGPCLLRLSPKCKGMAAELHHVYGRGLGGGKRDDRMVMPTCRPCHDIAEEQRRKGGEKLNG